MSAVAAAAVTGAPAGAGIGFARRALDITVSLVLLLLLSPVVVAIAIAVKVGDFGPVLFRQQRVGENGQLFSIYKFRTMRVAAEGSDLTVWDDQRVTRLGARLRGKHLDELPQLFNVLFGHMTLVGPRPETPALANRYPPNCRAVLAYRPGLTGPCQLKATEIAPPAGCDPEDYYLTELVPLRVALDFEYLTRPTVRNTFVVLAQTALAVVRPPTANLSRGHGAHPVVSSEDALELSGRRQRAVFPLDPPAIAVIEYWPGENTRPRR